MRWMLLGALLWGAPGCDDEPSPGDPPADASSSATTDEGATRPDGGPIPDAAPQPDAGTEAQLVLNEIAARPLDGADWVELLVIGPPGARLELSDYTLVDDNPDHAPAALPARTLTVGEFVVIEAGGDPPALPFGLGGSDALTLARGGEVMGQVSWGAEDSASGTTYGRLPDATGAWTITRPTPGAPNQTAEGTPTTLFPPLGTVVSVELEMAPGDWAALLADPEAEEYLPADLVFEGVRVEQVAVRAKGNSSLNAVRRDGSPRLPLKVDINRYVDGQRLFGKKKFVLNNGFKDPSFMRETLAYALMRALELPAPRTAFADVTVAGQHLGLYTLVEAVDGDFIEEHFEDDTGDLYKPENPAGALSDRGDSYQQYESASIQTNEETTDHAAFLQLIRALNRDQPLEASLDVEGALRYLAINAVLVNLDSYLGTGHNYYLYEQDGVFTVIPWDVNEAFGLFTCGCRPQALLAFPIDAPVCGRLVDRPLAHRLLESPEWRGRYREWVRVVVEQIMSLEEMTARVVDLAGRIRPYVVADPTAFFTVEEFDRAVAPGGGLLSFIEARRAAVLAQLEVPLDVDGACQGGGPGPGMHPCGDGVCDEAERGNPRLCPRDCEERPDDFDWCGDGICDALERREGSCPQDCMP